FSMNKFLFILCFISAINAQFDPPDTQYKGFSKINCLGLIISGLDDSVLLSEIEKSFISISEKTLSKEIAFGPFTDCPLYPLSIQFFILQNNDDSYSGTISVALEGTAESTTIEVKYPTVDKENWYYQVGFMPIIEDIQIISNSDNSQILSQTKILIQRVLDRFALSLIENP
ncbi:MAG: hypothetical protein VYD20_03910, partial [Candidatus Neomarinimicrobiota bacterium]|nr:hypothetical protein [Candidatus Neomarinimicrobiota bacterium]